MTYQLYFKTIKIATITPTNGEFLSMEGSVEYDKEFLQTKDKQSLDLKGYFSLQENYCRFFEKEDFEENKEFLDLEKNLENYQKIINSKEWFLETNSNQQSILNPIIIDNIITWRWDGN